MAEFSKAELEDAQKAISSSIRKIEKAQETLSKKEPLPKAQLTLASRKGWNYVEEKQVYKISADNSEDITKELGIINFRT